MDINVPDNWEESPSEVIIGSFDVRQIGIRGVWRNKDTGQVLIHYKTKFNKHYLEVHEPDEIESRFKKILNILNGGEGEIGTIPLQSGQIIEEGLASERELLNSAEEHMKNN